jgi:ribose 5-phosphate isomerase B
MKIAIGSDHAGYGYKEEIKKLLQDRDCPCHDFGTHGEESVDYPRFVRPVAEAVARGEADRGIVLGGSGNGEAMTANRITGIRCALCWSRETAELARRHNNANMLSIGQRMISLEAALEIVSVWLDTPFDGGRHQRRIAMIDGPERVPGHSVQSTDGDGPDPKQEPEPVIPTGEKTHDYDLMVAFRYIKYFEGDQVLEFQVDPGLKSPSVIHIPSPERWHSEMPEWARDRREEILDRIKSKCGHLECEWKPY